jgi:hypothetical protein
MTAVAPDAGLADLAERPVTVVTARVVDVRGLLARVAVQLNPFAVRDLHLSLDGGHGTLRVVVDGSGFDAGRVVARLDKVIGVLDVTRIQLADSFTN